MENIYKSGKYPIADYNAICMWWQTHRQYDINQHADYIEIVERDPELVKQDRIFTLKEELEKIKEDIEQENFGIIRDDYAIKRSRAAEIVNELRVLEGKEKRSIT